MKQGILIILSGPPGTGKGSLRKMIIREKLFPCTNCIADTTRRKQLREKDGKKFHFISPYEFSRRKENGYYLFTYSINNEHYGFSAEMIQDCLNQGENIILDLDTKLALELMPHYKGMYTLTFFIAPPTMEELERRMRRSGKSTEEEIQAAITEAKEDMNFSSQFDVVLTNYNLKKTAKRFATSANNRLKYIEAVEGNLPLPEGYIIKRP